MYLLPRNLYCSSKWALAFLVLPWEGEGGAPVGTGWRFPGLGWIFRTWLLGLKVASSLGLFAEGWGWRGVGAEPWKDGAWFVWGDSSAP